MKNKKLSEYTYSVLDIETTGLSPYKGCKIVEIAAIKVEPSFKLNLNNYFSELINPEISIPYNAYKIHKISNQMVSDAPIIDDVLPKLADFIQDSVIVAHNAKFDMGFINYFCKSCNLHLPHIDIIDTLTVSRKLFPGFKSHKLDVLIDYFDIDLPVEESWRHRALFDAAHTAILLQKLIDKVNFIESDITLESFLSKYN